MQCPLVTNSVGYSIDDVGPMRLLSKRRGFELASVASDNDASRRRSLKVGFEVWRHCTLTGQYLQNHV